jgi:replicative DNA helicase
MNALAPLTVDLTEPQSEGAVLGALICYPDALAVLGGEVRPEWFADPAGRSIADSVLELHRNGHRITPAAVIAGIPSEVEEGGMTRAQVVAQLCGQAVPLAMVSGPLSILRDRWARRMLVAEAERLARDAVAFDVDPFDAVAETLAALDPIAEARGERVSGSLLECADLMFEGIANPDRPQGATTGLRDLDQAFGDWQSTKLYIVAGRPGMGKSAFACSSLRRTAAAGHGVALFSLEMDRVEIASRCTSDALDTLLAPGYGDLAQGLFGREWDTRIAEARESFGGLPLHVDAAPRLTMVELAARARAVKARFEATGKRLAVVGVDHMGLVDPSNRYAGNKVAETGEVSRAAKVLAKELGCAVLLLCQLSREVEKREDKRPTLADLRWSGDVEQDADFVGFVHRPAYYLDNDPKASPDDLRAARHRLEFLIRKNRAGATGDVPLWCSIAHSSIRDLARGAQ